MQTKGGVCLTEMLLISACVFSCDPIMSILHLIKELFHEDWKAQGLIMGSLISGLLVQM